MFKTVLAAAQGMKTIVLVLILLPLFIRSSAAETIQLVQDHGVYMISVRINGQMTIPFVLDTGASEVAIPNDVFRTLLRTGTIKDADFIGDGIYTMADGSQHSSKRFVLREIKVGNETMKNVVANVVPMEGDPLLGQSFLSKLPSWSINNEKHTLVIGNNEKQPDKRVINDKPVLPGPYSTPPGLIYLSQRLHNPTYKTTFDNLFRGAVKIPPWFVTYLKTQSAAESPEVKIEIGGWTFEHYRICEPHNCSGSFMHVMFVPGGQKAWAEITFDSGDYVVYGRSRNPIPAPAEESFALDYLFGTVHQ
jgi:clan AA aspartic protease (TIGR02281 family)